MLQRNGLDLNVQESSLRNLHANYLSATPTQQNQVTLDFRYPEKIFDYYHEELAAKSSCIERLREENKDLSERLRAIDAVFEISTKIIGYALPINLYIMCIALFVSEKRLVLELRSYMHDNKYV